MSSNEKSNVDTLINAIKSNSDTLPSLEMGYWFAMTTTNSTITAGHARELTCPSITLLENGITATQIAAIDPAVRFVSRPRVIDRNVNNPLNQKRENTVALRTKSEIEIVVSNLAMPRGRTKI